MIQYHGGTDFGRTSSAMMATSYDYDAPLDEYGRYSQNLFFFFWGMEALQFGNNACCVIYKVIPTSQNGGT